MMLARLISVVADCFPRSELMQPSCSSAGERLVVSQEACLPSCSQVTSDCFFPCPFHNCLSVCHSGHKLHVIAAMTTTGSRNMFLGIPGISCVASGMTEAGRKFSFTVFETHRQLAEAKEQIIRRLTDIDPSGHLLEGEQVACAIDSSR